MVVYIVALGLRKEGDKVDVYDLAQRLLRQGLLAPESDEEGDEGVGDPAAGSPSGV
jgi:hypothetical protein